MPIHPTLVAMSRGLTDNPDYRPTHALPPAQAREGYRLLARAFRPLPEVARVEDRAVPAQGHEIPVRVYTPQGPGPHPVLVYFHGGGWVIGDLDTHDRECRELCNGAGCLVVAVDYRRAPEHPHPAPVEDAWTAYRWIGEHAAQLGGDGERLAVAGDSAGGNLAAVCTLLARDHGGPRACFQFLVYPGVAGSTSEYASYQENAEAPFLPLETIEYFRHHYLGPDYTSTTDPRIAPIHAASHANLPPALILTAEYDPLRDEGADYARKLDAAGVPVRHIEYAGMTHLFFQLSPILEEGKAALREGSAALRAAFAG